MADKVEHTLLHCRKACIFPSHFSLHHSNFCLALSSQIAILRPVKTSRIVELFHIATLYFSGKNRKKKDNCLHSWCYFCTVLQLGKLIETSLSLCSWPISLCWSTLKQQSLAWTRLDTSLTAIFRERERIALHQFGRQAAAVAIIISVRHRQKKQHKQQHI